MDASARSRAGWTPERRARHADKIREWKPWEQSTGPRTSAGKAVSSRNAVMSESRAKVAVIRARIDDTFRAYARLQREIKRGQRVADALEVRRRKSSEKSQGCSGAAAATKTCPADLYLRMLSGRSK
jgi:hypothetical protein